MAKSLLQRKVAHQQAKRTRQRKRATHSVADATRPAAAEPVPLPNTDMHINRVTLGTMTWGQQNSEKEAHDQLDLAVHGYGLHSIDTAEMYPVPTSGETQGLTDKYIGTWLQKQRREDLVIMTKVSGRSGITYLRDNGETTDVTPKQIRESVEKSLLRLGIDEIDLLQIHWPARYSANAFGMRWYNKEKEYESVPIREQLEGLKEMYEEGKIRSIGLSNETPYGITRFATIAEEHNLPPIASTQNGYNLLSRIQQEWSLPEALSYCNVGFLAYSPLAGGMLSNKYADGAMPEGSRFTLFSSYMSRYQRSKEVAKLYADVAHKHGMTPSELALKFCKARPFVTSTIIGATRLDQLRDDLDAFEGDLSDEVLQDTNEVFWSNPDPSTVE